MRTRCASLALVLGLVLVEAGCGGGGQTDTGCRDCLFGCCQAGRCMPGNQLNACGSSGLQCFSCQGGMICVNGQCMPPQNYSTPSFPSSPAPGSCNSSNCAGCCTAGGVCLQSASQSAMQCGGYGQLCQPCNNGQCSAGRCTTGVQPGGVPSCNYSNCMGCCSQTGQCLLPSMQNSYQCGISGQLCQSCGAGQCNAGVCAAGGYPPGGYPSGGSTGSCNYTTCPGGCCTNWGQCVQPMQQTSAQCGSSGQLCQSCAGGQCTTGRCSSPGSSTYPYPTAGGARLLAVSATVLPKLDGTPWDESDLFSSPEPDPYLNCRVLMSGKSESSSTVTNSFNPQFNNEELLVDSPQNLAGGISCEVREDDTFGYETMGNCTFSGAVGSGPVYSSFCTGQVQDVVLYLATY